MSRAGLGQLGPGVAHVDEVAVAHHADMGGEVVPVVLSENVIAHGGFGIAQDRHEAHALKRIRPIDPGKFEERRRDIDRTDQ